MNLVAAGVHESHHDHRLWESCVASRTIETVRAVLQSDQDPLGGQRSLMSYESPGRAARADGPPGWVLCSTVALFARGSGRSGKTQEVISTVATAVASRA